LRHVKSLGRILIYRYWWNFFHHVLVYLRFFSDDRRHSIIECISLYNNINVDHIVKWPP
jgi:hypothetical protein